MPRLVHSSETVGCGATIELDSGDVCMISVAQGGVLVRTYRKGLFGALFGSFMGAVLYNEKNVYTAAQTARVLSALYPEQSTSLVFRNAVLAAFWNAVWHCKSAAEASVVLNEVAHWGRIEMNIRIAMKLAFGVVATSLLSTATTSAQNGPYMSDVPKLYPGIHMLWTQSLPYALGPLPDWIASFNGVVSPIRDVSLSGASMKFSTTCKPHDCGGNIAGILFSPQRNRIVALIRLSSQIGSNVMIIGPMTSAEFSCVQRLIDDHQSTLC